MKAQKPDNAMPNRALTIRQFLLGLTVAFMRSSCSKRLTGCAGLMSMTKIGGS